MLYAVNVADDSLPSRVVLHGVALLSEGATRGSAGVIEARKETEVLRPVVAVVLIDVVHFHPAGDRTDEGLHNQAMDQERRLDSLLAQSHATVALLDTRTQDLPWQGSFSSASELYCSIRRTDSSHVAHLIKAFVAGDVFPNFVF